MKEVISYLEKTLKKQTKIVLGISGGPDSMCLFFILLRLKEKLDLTIICCHVNHNIRFESTEEALFVKKEVLKNNCYYEYYKIEKYDKENFESNARQKRYQFFAEIINKYQAEYLFTAHHGDDLMETILMRLIRGSNLKGYAGFKRLTNYPNYQVIRPFITITKSEILEFNRQNNIEYRLDKTNQDEKYTRARYRQKILPILKEENKNIHRKFFKFSEDIYMIEKYLEKETNKILTKVVEFDKVNLRKFNQLDKIFQIRILELFLHKEYQNDINCLTKKHLDKILTLCKSNKANIKLSLPKKRILIKSYNLLYFFQETKIINNNTILTDYVNLDNIKIIKIDKSEIKKSNNIIRLNSSEIKLPLHVRFRKKGDNMTIKNLSGSKKLKTIFINEKIPLSKRDRWPIITDNEDNILWLPGLKKSKFDKNINEFYDIIYKCVISEEKKDTYDK